MFSGEACLSLDTYQFGDYSKVVPERFDPREKAKRREELLPQECRKDFAMGCRLAGKHA